MRKKEENLQIIADALNKIVDYLNKNNTNSIPVKSFPKKNISAAGKTVVNPITAVRKSITEEVKAEGFENKPKYNYSYNIPFTNKKSSATVSDDYWATLLDMPDDNWF